MRLTKKFIWKSQCELAGELRIANLENTLRINELKKDVTELQKLVKALKKKK